MSSTKQPGDYELPQPVEPIYGIRVVLKSIDADRFIGLGPEGFEFVETIPQALEFDYIRDEVPRSIWEIQHRLGHHWAPVPLNPGDYYETCDRCRKYFQVTEIFFDGKTFTCLYRCQPAVS